MTQGDVDLSGDEEGDESETPALTTKERDDLVRLSAPFGGLTPSEAGLRSAEATRERKRREADGVTAQDLRRIAGAWVRKAETDITAAKLVLDYAKLLRPDAATEPLTNTKLEDMTPAERERERAKLVEMLRDSDDSPAQS